MSVLFGRQDAALTGRLEARRHGCQLRQHLPAITASGIEENQQDRLATELRQRLAPARQVCQLERRRFTAERQTFRLIGAAELEFVEPLVKFIQPQQNAAILAEQLRAQPAADEDGKPREGQQHD